MENPEIEKNIFATIKSSIKSQLRMYKTSKMTWHNR